MYFLVVLDTRTTAGQLYRQGNNDGVVSEGDITHPILKCLEVVTDSPNYVFVKRDLSSKGRSHQSVYLPHHAVVAIYRMEEDAQRPFGFLPAGKE